ncbi:S-adenosyl-L-methionine-dependent methyltransferase [Phytophthora cactorum]|nr:S-adenosyl-L-methionine-dependent methyltransferase [Phytophthora cactorum]
MESPNGRRNDEEEEDDAWALELEEELDLAGTTSAVGTVHESKVELEEKQAPGSEQKMKEKAALARPSVATTLPQEVWLLLSVSAKSDALTDILRPLDSNALAVALDVEAELYAAYGQSYSLTKAYAHKARALLFNLKDSRNVDLRNRLLSGELPSHSLVRMSGPDMANPQLARQRKEWIRKRTHEVMRDGREAEGFESDLFECRNCGSSRTRYRQWRRKAVVDRTRIIHGPFVNRDYESQEFDFGVVKQKLLCSHAASTDHDLTGQVVWPVSAFLAWYLVAHREEIAARTSWSWVPVRASVVSSPRSSRIPLLWGDHKSVEAFERAFPYPVDVLIGADVVCWPILVKPILQTIKYLLLRSRNPLETKFCCGFVCRAQSTEDLFFKEAVAFGFRFERIPGDAFLPTPRPADVTSNRELQLIVFTLDPQPQTGTNLCGSPTLS